MSKKLDEFGLIESYFAPLSAKGAFNLKDDAALIATNPDEELVITQDAVAEGIHFFADDPADVIAQKALRVNLSDLVAKGAKPVSFSLALGIGNNTDENWIADFANGLARDCQRFGISLNGGDTFRTGAGVIVSITAIGTVPQNTYTSRLGASVGDHLYVTGTIGNAALGLLGRQGKDLGLPEADTQFLTDHYLLPQPRLQCIDVIRQYASASMDISDGLVADIGKLCAASKTGFRLETDKIPFTHAVQSAIARNSKLLQTAITGGDDYEILFAVPPSHVEKMANIDLDLKLRVTPLGTLLEEAAGVTVVDRDGSPLHLEYAGYNHFGETG